MEQIQFPAVLTCRDCCYYCCRLWARNRLPVLCSLFSVAPTSSFYLEIRKLNTVQPSMSQVTTYRTFREHTSITSYTEFQIFWKLGSSSSSYSTRAVTPPSALHSSMIWVVHLAEQNAVLSVYPLKKSKFKGPFWRCIMLSL